MKVLLFGGKRDPGLILAVQTVYTITAPANNFLRLPLVARQDGNNLSSQSIGLNPQQELPVTTDSLYLPLVVR